MKTIYRCVDCSQYTLRGNKCPQCGAPVQHPYPAKFSLVKEEKYRRLIRKQTEQDLEQSGQ